MSNVNVTDRAAVRLRGYYAIFDVAAGTGGGVGGGGDEGGAAPLEERARALLAAGPCCLQLRAKHASAGELCAMGARLAALCRTAGVPFCVNDRLDVALVVGADVVHLGQDDLPLADARHIVAAMAARDGRRPLIGVSTHNLAQARAAAADSADYIGVGPVFATATKRNPDPEIGIDGLALICRAVNVPVVAIGGITPASTALCARAGAAAVAVVAAVAQAPDPTSAGRAVNAAFRL